MTTKSHEDYTVGWICLLEMEQIAIESLHHIYNVITSIERSLGVLMFTVPRLEAEIQQQTLLSGDMVA